MDEGESYCALWCNCRVDIGLSRVLQMDHDIVLLLSTHSLRSKHFQALRVNLMYFESFHAQKYI